MDDGKGRVRWHSEWQCGCMASWQRFMHASQVHSHAYSPQVHVAQTHDTFVLVQTVDHDDQEVILSIASRT